MSNNDILIQPETDFENSIDDISSKYNGTCNITDLEKMVEEMLQTLPKLKRNELRKEMEEMEVPTSQAPTTFDINRGLSISQGYKDRLTEIHTMATREYKLRKRCVEMLFDANNIVSKASSADKRKGEATMKYPMMLIQMEASETFMKEVEQVLANIKSASDTISRQGSMIQSQIQLGEYRKKNPEDFNNLGNGAEEVKDYHSGAPKINIDWNNV